MMTSTPLRILIVDDDPSIRASLADALNGSASIELACSGEEAVVALQTQAPDIMLCDVRMPGMSGLELLTFLRKHELRIPVVLMTAYDDMQTVVTAMREGAVEFLVKPVDLHDLRKVIRRLGDDRSLQARERLVLDDNRSNDVGALIGRDPRMIEAFKLVGQAAASRANVLIRGESGTGKELIARAIHHNSDAAKEPFVAVNCTALPAGLLESELFGHVRGSFTGASSNRRGRFALAGRGSIFLDEIGDTTPEFQTKLLRVFEDHEVYPVGAERPEKTDARVIAATHRNLESMIADGRFRADLYYRLDVLVIHLPPLRERTSDIPLLAQHLLARSGAALNRSVRPILSADALEALLCRSWPGNVRELENVLMRALVLCAGDVIRVEHLSAAAGVNSDTLATLTDLERQHLKRVLEATGAHKARTAEILGISRPRLDRLLRKHGL